jgi:translation initiation factor 4E
MLSPLHPIMYKVSARMYSLTSDRETVKRILSLPEGTNIVWRSHDDSIAQRTAIDQARHEKSNHQGHEKRRVTSTDESQREKP